MIVRIQNTAVLVAGVREKEELVQGLHYLGLIPLVRWSMKGALDLLHRESFKAVIVSQKCHHIDPLEFVLNVRDINLAVPIIVVGPAVPNKTRSILKEQAQTYLCDTVYELNRILPL